MMFSKVTLWKTTVVRLQKVTTIPGSLSRAWRDVFTSVDSDQTQQQVHQAVWLDCGNGIDWKINSMPRDCPARINSSHIQSFFIRWILSPSCYKISMPERQQLHFFYPEKQPCTTQCLLYYFMAWQHLVLTACWWQTPHLFMFLSYLIYNSFILEKMKWTLHDVDHFMYWPSSSPVLPSSVRMWTLFRSDIIYSS